jgi:hypothetical protein
VLLGVLLLRRRHTRVLLHLRSSSSTAEVGIIEVLVDGTPRLTDRPAAGALPL